jgi:hypothetical protein
MPIENAKKKTRKKRTTKKIEGTNPPRKRKSKLITPNVIKGATRESNAFHVALATYLDTCGISPGEAYFLGCSITAFSETLKSINPPVMKRLLTLLTGTPGNVNPAHIENTPDL